MRRTKSRATRTKSRRCAAGSIEDYPTRLGFRGMRAFSPRCLQCREQHCCHAASRVQHCCSAALIRAHFFGPLPTHAMQAKQTWTARLEPCAPGEFWVFESVTTVRCRPSVPCDTTLAVPFRVLEDLWNCATDGQCRRRRSGRTMRERSRTCCTSCRQKRLGQKTREELGQKTLEVRQALRQHSIACEVAPSTSSTHHTSQATYRRS